MNIFPKLIKAVMKRIFLRKRRKLSGTNKIESHITFSTFLPFVMSLEDLTFAISTPRFNLALEIPRYKLKKIQKNLSCKIFLLNNVDNAGSKIAAVCCVVQRTAQWKTFLV